MTSTLFASIKAVDSDSQTKVIILTGMDPYYCAGVNLAGSFQVMHPKKMFNEIVARNEALFNTFLDRKKPMIVAVNGPAIGASVTSATLCDAIIASNKAKFLTPFGRLGVTPEGCSSVHFEYLIGSKNAKKMLEEDWEPTATEAKEIGLITDVVPHQSLAELWIQQGKDLEPRTAMGYSDLKKLKEVNAKESVDLGHAFLSEKFLKAQVKFLESKKKNAFVFKSLVWTRPLWSKLL
jgi:Delta3-Delta2-enoyl-CoA isomerase